MHDFPKPGPANLPRAGSNISRDFRSLTLTRIIAASPWTIAYGDEPAERTFSQQQVNELLARDKRHHQAQHQKTLDHLQQLEQNKSLSDRELAGLRARAQELESALPAEQQLTSLRDRHAQELAEIRSKGDHFKGLYTQDAIANALTSAASAAGAFNPDQLIALLRNKAQLVDGPNGPAVQIDGLSVAAVVAQMKADPANGNLFKSESAGGLGAQGTSAPRPTDPNKPPPASDWRAFLKWRRERGYGRKP